MRAAGREDRRAVHVHVASRPRDDRSRSSSPPRRSPRRADPPQPIRGAAARVRRRSATDDVGSLRRSVEPATVVGPFRAVAGAAPRWAHARSPPTVADRPAPRRSSSTRTTGSGKAWPDCWRSVAASIVVGSGRRAGTRPSILAPTPDPDVVIVDPRLPDVEGGLRLHRPAPGDRAPDIRVLVMTGRTTLERAACDGGADAFIAQDIPPERADRGVIAAAAAAPPR